mmetsp:Transcript_79425/g.199581  ORF Transcript_79425/g.199581 Transcript_79425/m.199581 type:complete len:283 (+) Transcript_79425:164-1012(+)
MLSEEGLPHTAPPTRNEELCKPSANQGDAGDAVDSCDGESQDQGPHDVLAHRVPDQHRRQVDAAVPPKRFQEHVRRPLHEQHDFLQHQVSKDLRIQRAPSPEDERENGEGGTHRREAVQDDRVCAVQQHLVWHRLGAHEHREGIAQTREALDLDPSFRGEAETGCGHACTYELLHRAVDLADVVADLRADALCVRGARAASVADGAAEARAEHLCLLHVDHAPDAVNLRHAKEDDGSQAGHQLGVTPQSPRLIIEKIRKPECARLVTQADQEHYVVCRPPCP